MTAIAKILVATDFSLDGQNAIRRAALLAQQLDAHLTLFHVVESATFKPLHDWFLGPIDIDLKTAQARSILRQLSAETAASHDANIRMEVRVGRPHDELLRASTETDLLVIGQRGRQSIRRMVLGGTADRMLRTSRTPVLVVKRKAEAPYQRVLVPVGLTSSSGATVQVAASLSQHGGIQVFHAIDSRQEAVLREADVPLAVRNEIRARYEARINVKMRRSVERLGLDGRRVSFTLARGASVPAALQRLRASPADLVVVGKQDGCAIARYFLRGVSGRLLTESECDTLIVPRRARALTQPSSPFEPSARLTASHRQGSVV